jgi:hypothetical protein
MSSSDPPPPIPQNSNPSVGGEYLGGWGGMVTPPPPNPPYGTRGVCRAKGTHTFSLDWVPIQLRPRGQNRDLRRITRRIIYTRQITPP